MSEVITDQPLPLGPMQDVDVVDGETNQEEEHKKQQEIRHYYCCESNSDDDVFCMFYLCHYLSDCFLGSCLTCYEECTNCCCPCCGDTPDPVSSSEVTGGCLDCCCGSGGCCDGDCDGCGDCDCDCDF